MFYSLLRPFGVAISRSVEPVWGHASGSFLRATAAISKGATIAAIPESSVLSVSKLPDIDSIGFSASPNFLERQQPLAVLSHHVAVQFCLQHPWYRAQIPLYTEEKEAEKFIPLLEAEYVMAPVQIFCRAFSYVSKRIIDDNGQNALVPVVDLISKRRNGNVVVHIVTAQMKQQDNISGLLGKNNHLRKSKKGARSIVIEASQNINCGTCLALSEPPPTP